MNNSDPLAGAIELLSIVAVIVAGLYKLVMVIRMEIKQLRDDLAKLDWNT